MTGEGSEYLSLLHYASSTARRLIANGSPPSVQGRAGFIYNRCQELAKFAPDFGDTANQEPDGIAVEMLRLLEENWDEVTRGLTGEDILRRHAGLWDRLMYEWPMGAYAQIAADHLALLDLEHYPRVLEVGSGVGAVIRKRPELAFCEYIRSDLNPFVLPRNLPGKTARFDFNAAGEWNDLDMIFGVNALHCADDPAATLNHLADMLKPGGTLFIVEGENPTDPEGTPWALNHLFGLFDGWWNIGGFLTLEKWQHLFEEVGFVNVSARPYTSGVHRLGGLVTGLWPGTDDRTAAKST